MMDARELEQLLAEMDRRLLEDENRSADELFEELVHQGFIDRQGRVTKLIGGDAEMEPDARPVTEEHESA